MGQVSDQSAKGGVIGIVMYFMVKYNVDPALVALATPLIATVLAVVSKKVGDPEIASFFNDKKPS